MEKTFMWGDQTLSDLIDGTQVNSPHKEYYIDDMEGIIDIGKIKPNQEDALLMLSNNDVRLMAICDGIGGFPGSERASQFSLITLGKWFQERNINSSISDIKILKELKNVLYEINTEIVRRSFGGTTLVLALKLLDRTITINVGDSRIYSFDNLNLNQVSKDHSLAWRDYEKGRIKNKDDIRFCKYNNIIDNYLGGYVMLDDYIIDNDDYSDLLLVSDGVSDIVSDDDLFNILKNEYENAVKKIVETSLTKEEVKMVLDYDLYNDRTYPGKDNISAIVYKKGLK